MPWEAKPSLSERPPSRERGVVEVWRVCLSGLPEDVARLVPTLSPSELDRANRFRFERDGRRFVAARGLLRLVLSYYLNTPPSELKFTSGEFGKPALAPPFDRSGTSFNVAHSGDLALFAVAHGRQVGVDVEGVKHNEELESVARHFFSAREFSSLRALPITARARGFFDCWTRKEAYIKARGEGVSFPLERFSVSFTPAAATLEVEGEPGESSRWRVRPLALGADYAGALVAEGDDWELREREMLSPACPSAGGEQPLPAPHRRAPFFLSGDEPPKGI